MQRPPVPTTAPPTPTEGLAQLPWDEHLWVPSSPSPCSKTVPLQTRPFPALQTFAELVQPNLSGSKPKPQMANMTLLFSFSPR